MITEQHYKYLDIDPSCPKDFGGWTWRLINPQDREKILAGAFGGQDISLRFQQEFERKNIGFYLTPQEREIVVPLLSGEHQVQKDMDIANRFELVREIQSPGSWLYDLELNTNLEYQPLLWMYHRSQSMHQRIGEEIDIISGSAKKADYLAIAGFFSYKTDRFDHSMFLLRRAQKAIANGLPRLNDGGASEPSCAFLNFRGVPEKLLIERGRQGEIEILKRTYDQYKSLFVLASLIDYFHSKNKI